MSAQYEILTQMLLLLKTAELSFTRLSRSEYLIYRIKILLLKRERSSDAELNRLCPVVTLERLHQLLSETAAHGSTRPAVERLEEELERLILHFEENIPSNERESKIEMTSSSCEL
jgi:hypothetical protein